MHHLKQVTIQNFRSCQDVTLTLADCTPIVGYNNAGKSNLLDAIEWFLTGRVLVEADFYNPGEPIHVKAVMVGLEQTPLDQLARSHRDRIEPFIDEGCLTLRRVQPAQATKKSDLKIEVRSPEESNDNNDVWQPNPGGIDNAIKALFPTPITIGAMEDAAEDTTKAKTSSTIGKLLAQFTEPVEAAHGQELQDSLDPLMAKLSPGGDNRAAELKRFDQEATQALAPFFPGIQLHLDIPVPSIQELFGKGTIRVSENGQNTVRDITALGHGAQRSIQMALIRYLAEVTAQQSEGTQRRLLIIEEPELFLHPQAIQKVRQALESLSQSGYQVIYATHSPLMVERHAAARTTIVRKTPTDGCTHITPTVEQALERRVADNSKRLHTLFALENASHWLFSDHVLIAEGDTERYLLPAVYSAITGRQTADDGLAIISFGGAGALTETLGVFKELGVHAKALADFDFAANDAVKHGLIDQDDTDLWTCLNQIKTMAKADPNITIGGNSRPRADKTNPSHKKSAQVFREWAATPEARPAAEALHQKLRSHNIWLWTGGDIEHHLGLDGSKDVTTWVPFRDRLEMEAYNDVIHDNETVADFVSWLSAETIIQ